MNSIVQRTFPLGFPWTTRDPFLFCVHHLDFYPQGNGAGGPVESLAGRSLGNDFDPRQKWRMYHGTSIPGFPAHPHRGFETVTVVTQGFIDHSDSLGAAGRFGQGDVQWMTAGKGVQHCEMFPLLETDKPNTLELFQIWLNLPRRSKLCPPYFSMLWNEKLPVLGQSAGARVKVVAGAFAGVPAPPPDSWAADPANELAIIVVELSAGASWEMPAASAKALRTVYIYEGEVSIDSKIYSHAGLEVRADVALPISSTNGGKALILQGKPISEPVAQYGPFVMNTQAEIQEAFREYQQTEFGGWRWDRPDPIHPLESGRFAQYPDGRLERP